MAHATHCFGYRLLAGLFALLVYHPVQAADAGRGALLYDNHCLECHESHLHETGHSALESVARIGYYVNRWQRELSLGWTSEDIADVVAFLNTRYYHFDSGRPGTP